MGLPPTRGTTMPRGDLWMMAETALIELEKKNWVKWNRGSNITNIENNKKQLSKMKNELVTLYTELQLIISKLSNPLKTFIAFSIQKINQSLRYDSVCFLTSAYKGRTSPIPMLAEQFELLDTISCKKISKWTHVGKTNKNFDNSHKRHIE